MQASSLKAKFGWGEQSTKEWADGVREEEYFTPLRRLVMRVRTDRNGFVEKTVFDEDGESLFFKKRGDDNKVATSVSKKVGNPKIRWSGPTEGKLRLRNLSSVPIRGIKLQVSLLGSDDEIIISKEVGSYFDSCPGRSSIDISCFFEKNGSFA